MLNNIFLFVVLNCRTEEAKITNNIINQIYYLLNRWAFGGTPVQFQGLRFVRFHMNIFLFSVALPVLQKVIEIDVAVQRLSL